MLNIEDESNKCGLSAFALKSIAIIAMLIDHIAWAFVPTGTPLAQIMHIIGRIVAPIMAYFISEGYYHTRNMRKYALRLGMFALISHIPFYYFMSGTFPFPPTKEFVFRLQTSVIYTLFLGLVSLIVWDKESLSKRMKIALIILICIMAIPGDWNFILVLWVLFFHIYRDSFNDQISVFMKISIPIMLYPVIAFFTGQNNWYQHIFHIGIPLAIPLLRLYNGKPGSSKNSKWLFYIFYPLHLLILGLIKFMVFYR